MNDASAGFSARDGMAEAPSRPIATIAENFVNLDLACRKARLRASGETPVSVKGSDRKTSAVGGNEAPFEENNDGYWLIESASSRHGCTDQ